MKNRPSNTKRVPHVLILGTGIAGLSTALKFANGLSRDGRIAAPGAASEANAPEIRITLVAKAEAAEGSTRYAQGGIASVWSKEDSFEEHKRDTHVAGAGLCQETAVDLCVREGPERVRELIELGVEFTRAHGRASTDPADQFDLHREGGHGQRRILHAADLTGWAIEKALLAQVAANPRITLLEDYCAIDLITEKKLEKRLLRRPVPQSGACLGAHLLNNRTGQVETIAADLTVLATGGAGKAYLYTSNPDVATGDGIAMAHRAGARIANMEFIQFHPTCLYHPTARTFLITEALRGEGAILRNLDGEAFMDRHHPQGCLAPRDVVARAIDMEIKRTGHKHVWLDCTMIGAENLKAHFPNIHETCLSFGIDITTQAIPVVPAAHYTCGGVLVDEHGRTTIPGLYAVGEASCTGLHGANRLASNSLLEAVVYAHRVYLDGVERLKQPGADHALPPSESLPEWQTGTAVELEEQIDIAATWYEIRWIMWNYVGIVRSNHRLARAKKRLAMLKAEIDQYYWAYLLTKDLVELRNLVTVAELIVQCAELRKESRGLHYTVDYPATDDVNYRRDTVV